MKAIVQPTYGSPDDLQLRDIDQPTIGDQQRAAKTELEGQLAQARERSVAEHNTSTRVELERLHDVGRG